MAENKIHRVPIPPLHEYWDRPIAKEKGDADINVVFRSVGESLSSWEGTETVFSMMFSLFVGDKSIAAARAYGGIVSNAARREVLSNAAEIYFGNARRSSGQKDFDLLINHFGSGGGRRNEIAHGIIHSFNINTEDRGFFLVPTPYNSRKTDAKTPEWWKEAGVQAAKDPFKLFGNDYRYTSADLDHFTKLFQDLGNQATSFFMEFLMKDAQENFDSAPSSQKSSVQLGVKNASPPQGSE